MSIPDFEDILREAEKDDGIEDDDEEFDEDGDYIDPDDVDETIKTAKISNKIVETSMPPIPPALPQLFFLMIIRKNMNMRWMSLVKR